MARHPGDPEGFATRPNGLPYYIKAWRTGEREIHYTEPSLDPVNLQFYHAWSSSDQQMADEVALLMQRACGYFYLPDDQYKPLEGWDGVTLTDAEIRERIHRINVGENARELARVKRITYVTGNYMAGQGPNAVAFDFEVLPWDQQRALIEMLDEIKARWLFEWIDPDDKETLKVELKPEDFAEMMDFGD